MDGCGIPAARWPARIACPDAVCFAQRWRRTVALAGLLLLAVPWAWPQAAVLDFTRLSQAASRIGPRAERAAGDLRDLVPRLAAMDEGTRLARVNDFVNRRVLFTADTVAWDQEDYWASPLQTLSRGVGDCEDYAIAKYFILVAAGTPVDRLRLVYVRAALPPSAGQPASTQAHMVLAHYADNASEPSILDNLVPELRPSSGRPDLTPVFSFNGDRLWDGAGPRLAGDPMARLSRWREVVQRAREEGFP
jgi:predicted transglutaminase-like cysteine proteinase